MTEPEQSLKRAANVALAALAVLLVGSVVFYKERILFGDSAYIVFNIINFKEINIQEHRYGSFITQMVPYFALKLHLPVRAILLGYSMSFQLFYFSVASLLVYKLRQYQLAILMVLYYFLFVTDSYFWTNNEIHQAIAWLFLLFGVTNYMGKTNAKPLVLFPVFSLLAFLAVFTHFVVLIPLVFLWVYYLLEKNNWPLSKKTSLLLSLVLVLVVVTKFVVATGDGYDGAHLQGVTHFTVSDILGVFATPVVTVFAERSITLYWPALLILLLSITYLIKNKRWRLLVWTVVSTLGYFVIMGLAYGGYDKNYELFHIESEWAPLTIIIAIGFVFSFLPKLKPKHAAILLGAVFLIRLAYIGYSIPKFTWRSTFKKQVLAQMKKKGITKLALYEERDIREKLMLDWALTEESAMTSAMAGDEPQLSFRLVNKDDTTLINTIKNPVILSSCFTVHVPGGMNRDYYKTDTTRPYIIMTYEELMK